MQETIAFGGAELLRWPMQGVVLHAGVVQAGVQFTLFCALFYYLLAAKADPLLYAVRLLPLSDGARQQAATALSDALRGVFLCALKVDPSPPYP